MTPDSRSLSHAPEDDPVAGPIRPNVKINLQQPDKSIGIVRPEKSADRFLRKHRVIQHQFDDTFWAEDHAWNVKDAALRGSSYYVMPGFLSWLTANIGIHHVHHLYARIPFYRLPQVLREQARLANVARVSLLDSLRCAPLALWDEYENRLISFLEARRKQR